MVITIGKKICRCEYAYQRGVYWALENPISSLVFHYQPFEARALNPRSLPLPHVRRQALIARHGAFAVNVALGAYGAQTQTLAQSGCSLTWKFSPL